MRIQIIPWWFWVGFGFSRPPRDSSMSLIYDWYLLLGFIEIRRFHNLKSDDIEKLHSIWDSERAKYVS